MGSAKRDKVCFKLKKQTKTPTKMDLISALIGIVSLAFFIVPIVYLQIMKKNGRKKFLNNFMLLGRQHQVNISQHDFWNHSYAIGLDETANKLFFLKTAANTEQKISINLSEVEKCKLVNKNRTIDNNKIIDSLELVLTFRNPGMPEKTLEFYDREESMSVNEEVQLIEKWNTLINSRLEQKRRLSMAG